ncbi:hypothetical protein C0Q70_06611 [Pomacea canaliculata]|uniref:Uncharacterized protein n=1 Tax=Pomacea canaliculata TaxID=400727 RepID=A0A2T7PCQ5_POMCA|nr:hypothetical protein C0Q70_06611 [Pomacea canaliculata]
MTTHVTTGLSDPETYCEVTTRLSDPETYCEVTTRLSDPETYCEVTTRLSDPETYCEVTTRLSDPETYCEVTTRLWNPETYCEVTTRRLSCQVLSRSQDGELHQARGCVPVVEVEVGTGGGVSTQCRPDVDVTCQRTSEWFTRLP